MDALGDGRFAPDGAGVGTTTAYVRAERSGTKKMGGNGRVYQIGFIADDGNGGACSGEVLVGVPHDQNTAPIDDGALYDSGASVNRYTASTTRSAQIGRFFIASGLMRLVQMVRSKRPGNINKLAT